jgi:hypothetical protein
MWWPNEDVLTWRKKVERLLLGELRERGCKFFRKKGKTCLMLLAYWSLFLLKGLL